MASFNCSLSMIFAPSQPTMLFSVVAWSVRTVLLKFIFSSHFLCISLLFVLFASFLCSSSHVFSSLPVSPIYSAPQFLHGICYTSLPCPASCTLSIGCTSTRLRVLWGRVAVATPYYFITRCTLSETLSTYGITT